jgi:hypothetical protein
MYVNPNITSKGVIFYQTRTFEEYLGFILTLIGIITLFVYPRYISCK